MGTSANTPDVTLVGFSSSRNHGESWNVQQGMGGEWQLSQHKPPLPAQNLRFRAPEVSTELRGSLAQCEGIHQGFIKPTVKLLLCVEP